MPTSQEIVRQITGITNYVIRQGLADDFNMPILNQLGTGFREISFPNADRISLDLKGNPYEDVYQDWLEHRAFNILVPMGGMIQLMYTFNRRSLIGHRLAFYPSFRLEGDQGDESTFEENEYSWFPADDSGTPFSVRFDYNADMTIHEDIRHPRAHLTLGNRQHCRVPVTAPITPGVFVNFVLRNFLVLRDGHSYADGLPAHIEPFDATITIAERQLIHIGTPTR